MAKTAILYRNPAKKTGLRKVWLPLLLTDHLEAGPGYGAVYGLG